MIRRARKNGRMARAQRGLAIVELAVTAPLLLFVMFVTAEIGRAFMQYNTLTKSVRDAVRYVASNANLGASGVIVLEPALVQNAQNLVAYGTIDASNATLLLPGMNPLADVTVTSPNPFDVTVTAVYAYQPIVPVLRTFGLGAGSSSFFTFTAVTSMRAL